jgi:hypothetical protein
LLNRIFPALAIVLAPVAAHAWPIIHGIYGPPTSPCQTQFPNATCPPVGSAVLPYDQISSITTAATAISLPTTGTLPFLMPPTVNNSWTFVVTGVVNNADDPFYASNTAATQTWMAKCTTTACTDAGARFLSISSRHVSNSDPTQNNELLISAKSSTSGVSATNNLWMGNATYANPHTGITLTPNKTYCVAVQQYGADASSNQGLLYIYAYDSTGAAAPGSPAIASAVNYGSGATGFYNIDTIGGLRPRSSGTGVIGPLWAQIGAPSTTTAPAHVTTNGASGPFANAMMIYGVPPAGFGTMLSNYCQGLLSPTAFAGPSNYNGTLANLYTLSDATAGTYVDATATSSNATTLSGGVTPSLASPITSPNCLQLIEYGQNDVYSVSPGQTGSSATGTIYVNGKINWSACGLSPGGVGAAVFQGGSQIGSWVTTNPATGVFHIAVPSIPVTTATNSTCYTLSVRLNANYAYTVNGKYCAYVGWVIATLGQSQLNTAYSAQYGGAYGPASVVPTANTHYVVENMPLGDIENDTTGAFNGPMLATNAGLGVPVLMGVDAGNTATGGPTNNQTVIDYTVQLMNSLVANSGWTAVKLVNFSKSGQASDSWAYDYGTATTGTMTNTSGFNWTGTLATTQNITNGAFVTGFQASYLHGSVVVKNGSSVTLATDVQASPFHLLTGCSWINGNSFLTCLNVTGIAAATGSVSVTSPVAGLPPRVTVVSVSGTQVNLSAAVTTSPAGNQAVEFTNYGSLTGTGVTGTVDYLTGAISVTLSGADSGLVTTATPIQDTQAGTYNQQSPYAGFPTFGDGINSSSGYVTQIANLISGPLTYLVGGQCSANASNVTSPNPSTTSGQIAQVAKWDYTLGDGTNKMAGFWWWAAQPPAIVFPDYQRDGGGVNGGNIAGCSYFQQLFTSTVGYHFPSTGYGALYYGEDYWDYAIYCSTALASNCIGHAAQGQHGGQLGGRRLAYALNYIQTNSASPPVATLNGCQNTGSSQGGTPVARGATFTWMRCKFNIPVQLTGSSIATCGPTVSGAAGTGGTSAPTTAYCVSTTTAGSAVSGFRVGNSPTTMSNEYGVDETASGSGGALWSVQGQNTFAAVISSACANCVDVQNTSGGAWTWTSGTTLVSLEAMDSQLGGTVPSVTVTPGSGYSGTNVTLTATTGGCSAQPQVSVTAVAGALTAYVTSIGKGCTSQPTFTISGLGSGLGGAITAGWWTTATDLNYEGLGPYTNDGLTGGDAPGLPVRRSPVPTLIDCPYTGTSDGCSAGSSGQVQNPTFFGVPSSSTPGYAQQSKQGAYATRPPWNVAGVDYGVGLPSGQVLAAPVTAGVSNITGCVYSTSAGINTLTCTPTAGNITAGPTVVDGISISNAFLIAGYDFSGLVGAGQCVRLQIATTSYPVAIYNNNFGNGTGCAGASNAYLAQMQNGSTGALWILSNTFDGAAPVQTAATNLLQAYTTGNTTIEFNGFKHTPGRPVSYIGGNASTFVEKYNYFEGWVYLDGSIQGHGETTVITIPAAATATLIDVEFNTALQPNLAFSQVGNPGTVGSNTTYYVDLSNTTAGATQFTVSNNVAITNTNITSGGFTTAAAVSNLHIGQYTNVTFSNNYADGTGSVPGGATFYFTATSPGVCTNPATFSGNINMLTGATISGWQSNTASGC